MPIIKLKPKIFVDKKKASVGFERVDIVNFIN